ncbi:Superoxide dismutase, mitochondrial [Erysiphe neolycopersici]|uniref:Superoxide dismutase n=1 Tax=Erysiphe neolycopersici TaxID=212602 RepID=A0A420I2N5_9PEZI|nr:Superoxide dismutase, mitochondrial [Erysiphe neolycopersici]
MSKSEIYALPSLPYAYDALEPHISGQIMKLHHTKHHQTYVTNLNNTLESLCKATGSLDLVTQLHLQAALIFNGGGHINHTLFWENLAPAFSPSTQPNLAPDLIEAIKSRWKTLDLFKDSFTTVLLGIKGSGWGWLVQDEKSGILDIVTTKDQEVVPAGKKPLLGIDFWEHAYYLQYLNDKASYAKGIWNVINWVKVQDRFLKSSDSIYGGLKELRSEL